MCERIDLGNGAFAIVCGRGHKRPAPCRFCGKPSSKLCDYPMKKPVIAAGRQTLKMGTCDAPICNSCASSIGPDRDLCPQHARLWGIPQTKAANA